MLSDQGKSPFDTIIKQGPMASALLMLKMDAMALTWNQLLFPSDLPNFCTEKT